MPIDNQISPIEVRDLINQNQEILLIDLRNPEDFKKSHLPGSTNIPFFEISKNIPQFEGKQTVYLICENGSVSHRAQQLFEACSIPSFIVRGGLTAWKQIIDKEL